MRNMWFWVLVFVALLSGSLLVLRIMSRMQVLGGNTLYVELESSIDDKEIPKLADWMYQKIKNDKLNRIKAVFIYINSPGGSAASSETMYQLIKMAQKRGKKVVAYIHSVGASGGYYIASAADKIVANPAALTGSIGAIIVIPEITELSKKVGISWDIYKSGKNKDLTQPFRKRTEEDSLLLTELAKEIWKVFLNRVAESRGKRVEDLLPIADGRILTAEEALRWGLVDKLGTKYDALELLKKEARLKRMVFIKRKKKKSLLDQIIKGTSDFSNKIEDWMIPRANF
ncbi:MAG: signal peptide peptidase SppA [Thermotogae bacterium]|nr:signal peptide peptidase SppA [Thermotogota bacterium]